MLFPPSGRIIVETPCISKAGAHIAGSSGIVYPSVRRRGGTCIACFRPVLVMNVRQGGMVRVTLADAYSKARIEYR